LHSLDENTLPSGKEKDSDNVLNFVLPPPRDFKHSSFQAKVISPCTHDGICPLGKGVWCSFSQRSHSAMIRKDSAEKFSYVVIQKVLKNSPPSSDWLMPIEAKRDISRDPTPLATMIRMIESDEDPTALVDKLIDEVSTCLS
jgi:ribosomal protein RSM22 (predicted rRNA methylase)